MSPAKNCLADIQQLEIDLPDLVKKLNSVDHIRVLSFLPLLGATWRNNKNGARGLLNTNFRCKPHNKPDLKPTPHPPTAHAQTTMLATHQSCLLKPGDRHAPALCYISLPRQSASTHSAGYGVALLFPAHLTSWSTHPLSTPLPGCNWLCFAARCCWRVAHLFFFWTSPPKTTYHHHPPPVGLRALLQL